MPFDVGPVILTARKKQASVKFFVAGGIGIGVEIENNRKSGGQSCATSQ